MVVTGMIVIIARTSACVFNSVNMTGHLCSVNMTDIDVFCKYDGQNKCIRYL